MTVVAGLLLIAGLSSQDRPTGIVVATLIGEKAPEWSLDRKKSLSVLRSDAESHEFDFDLREGRAYVVDRRLYRQQDKKRYAGVLDELDQLFSAGQVVFSVPKDGLLTTLVKERFSPPSIDLAGAETGSYTIVPSMALRFTDGERVVQYDVQPDVPSNLARKLEEKPLKPGDGVAMREARERNMPIRNSFDIRPLAGFQVESAGAGASKADRRAHDFVAVSQILAEREDEWATRLRERLTSILHRLKGTYPGIDDLLRYEGPIGGLPDSMRQRASHAITGSWKHYGFDSETAAEVFMERSQVRAGSPHLLLACMTTAGSGYGLMMYSLPIP